MKRRSHHPHRKSRKLSLCTCKWCHEDFLAERSDSEYCCDSHKTLACNKRQEEKRAVRRRELEGEREFFRRKNVSNSATIQSASVKPPPIVKHEENTSDKLFETFHKQMEQMIQKSKNEMLLRERKFEFERNARLFNDIGERLMNCHARGEIGRFDLKTIAAKIEEIFNSESVRNQSSFTSRVHFIREQLLVLIDDLSEQEKANSRYRLSFKIPSGIIDDVRSLTESISIPTQL